jgi:hypothetical protein
VSSAQRRVVFRREAFAQLDELDIFVAAAGASLAAADLPRAVLDDHTPAVLFTALPASPDHSPLRR